MDVIIKLLLNIMSFLPDSPFQNPDLIDLSAVSSMLGWINWLIPFDTCTIIFGMWLAALSSYYIYRFFKSLVDTIMHK